MTKQLEFDANNVEVIASSTYYVTLIIETDYLDEVLCNLTPEEIVSNYGDIDELYQLLRDKYE